MNTGRAGIMEWKLRDAESFQHIQMVIDKGMPEGFQPVALLVGAPTWQRMTRQPNCI
jgi:hypothetical protein